jgi:hypothetical protein
MGIALDPRDIWEENAKKKDATRKNGCIINTGSNYNFF